MSRHMSTGQLYSIVRRDNIWYKLAMVVSCIFEIQANGINNYKLVSGHFCSSSRQIVQQPRGSCQCVARGGIIFLHPTSLESSLHANQTARWRQRLIFPQQVWPGYQIHASLLNILHIVSLCLHAHPHLRKLCRCMFATTGNVCPAYHNLWCF